ncbi:MAG: DUF3488 and transglutaminase-like domain-containing protein [Actinomycetota bacterium]
MAQPGEADAARGRFPVLVALLAFTVTTVLVFGRIYRGGGSMLKLMAAALGAVLIAAALERTHVLLSTLASAAGLLMALGLLVFPETTAYGLPTPETLSALRQAFGSVGTIAAREIAPVEPLPALLLAGLVAVWTASFAAHALVARAASGVLALLPAGALIAFADVVLEDGVRPAHMALWLAAAFAMLSTVGLRSVVRWGRLVPWGRAPQWSLFSTNALRAARRAAVPAVVSAILLPWMLPGLSGPGWYRIGRGTGAITIDPVVDLRPSLRLDPPRELFTVDSPRPAYWRMLSLDAFDGQRWSSTNLGAQNGLAVDGGTTLPTSADFGVSYRRLPAIISIKALSTPWLPVPYEPVFVDAGGRDLRFDPDLSTLVVPGDAESGLEYHAEGFIVSPQPSQIDRPIDATDDPLYQRGTRFTALPPNLPEAIERIAVEIVAEAGAETPYRQALAIMNHLRTFTYDDKVRSGHGSDYLLEFLAETQRGYCEQFAGAMAVLLRTLGIPSRVVVGFTPGTFDSDDGLRHVTTRNAHSWVEVHFAEYGWLPFEPTPSRGNPTQNSYLNPAPETDGGDGPTPSPGTPSPGGGPRGNQGDQGGLGPGELPEGSAPRSALVLTLAGAGLVILGLLIGVPLVKGAARRLALTRATEPGERVLAAYGVLSRRLADLGLERQHAETLWEFRGRLRESVRLEAGPLERLTRLAGRAAYGGGSITPEQAEEAVGLAATVAAGVRGSLSRGTRLRAPWRVPAIVQWRRHARGAWARTSRSWAAARP